MDDADMPTPYRSASSSISSGIVIYRRDLLCARQRRGRTSNSRPSIARHAAAIVIAHTYCATLSRSHYILFFILSPLNWRLLIRLRLRIREHSNHWLHLNRIIMPCWHLKLLAWSFRLLMPWWRTRISSYPAALAVDSST